MNNPKPIFISAGEQSGDMHASALMNEIKKLTDVQFYGLGGDLMISEGLNPIAHVKDLAATGLAEVAKKYIFFKTVLKKTIKKIYEIKPNAVILIDYPGFNLRLAYKIRKNFNGKIIYYISPQVWAWHEKRVNIIKKNIDKMLVVFPFEADFYKKFQVEAEYVGHPLIKKTGNFLKNNNRPARHDDSLKITLLPGSRTDEVKHHLPVLLQTVDMLKKIFKLDVCISKAPALEKKLYEDMLSDNKEYFIFESDMYSHLLDSDLVMTKAGTSSLECALIGTPCLIFYKTYPVNYYLLKPFVKIKNIGIVNILAGKNIVKEFIQKDFVKENLYNESEKILNDTAYNREMRNNFSHIRQIFGNADASVNAAKKIYQLALT